LTVAVLTIVAIVLLRDRLTAASIAATLCEPCSAVEEIEAAGRGFVNQERYALGPTIVGGRKTTASEFPTVGAILHDGALVCTGTLIGEKTVLTAAHCLDPYTPKRLAFKLGLSFEDGQAPAKAYDYAVFQGKERASRGARSHDVGLLYLEQPLKPELARYSIDAESGRLEEMKVNDADFEKIGYGYTSLSGSGAGTQRAATLRVASASAHFFTHGAPGLSICVKDSGGPSLVGNVIIGVTSTTTGCREGKDARVFPYRSWLMNRIR
jgi:V8-like Glu-specific endopeptidase